MTSHWDSFYKTWDIDLPSQFAIFVATEAKTARRLVDLGTGSGRDALFFSRRFDAVVALDKSAEAIRKARAKATRARLENLEFVQADLGEPGALDAVHDASSSGDVYYGRFFLHAITEETEHRLFAELARRGNHDDELYFEFRTTRDADAPKVFGDHYRRFIDPNALRERVEKLGFRCDYQVEGQGLAKFRDEDPWVARMIFRSSR